jgi:hypothetical protein
MIIDGHALRRTAAQPSASGFGSLLCQALAEVRELGVHGVALLDRPPSGVTKRVERPQPFQAEK